jgi:hypothetical protein
MSDAVRIPTIFAAGAFDSTTGKRRMRDRAIIVATSVSGVVGNTVTGFFVIHMLTNIGNPRLVVLSSIMGGRQSSR